MFAGRSSALRRLLLIVYEYGVLGSYQPFESEKLKDSFLTLPRMELITFRRKGQRLVLL